MKPLVLKVRSQLVGDACAEFDVLPWLQLPLYLAAAKDASKGLRKLCHPRRDSHLSMQLLVLQCQKPLISAWPAHLPHAKVVVPPPFLFVVSG